MLTGGGGAAEDPSFLFNVRKGRAERQRIAALLRLIVAAVGGDLDLAAVALPRQKTGITVT